MINPFSDISQAQEFTLMPKVNIDDGGGDKKKGKKDDKAQELSEEELQKLKDFNAQEEAIWDTLSASEQRYRRAENITKCAKLAKTEPVKAILVGEDIVLIEDLVFESKPLEIFIFRYTVQADKKAKKGEEKMEATISILKGDLSLEGLKSPGETKLELKLDLEAITVEDTEKDS